LTFSYNLIKGLYISGEFWIFCICLCQRNHNPQSLDKGGVKYDAVEKTRTHNRQAHNLKVVGYGVGSGNLLHRYYS